MTLWDFFTVDHPYVVFFDAPEPIPVEPPIPTQLAHVVLKPDTNPGNLPAWFRNEMPGYPQMLDVLFVTDTFKSAWESAGLIGGAFRALD